jgi:hypothetical protein
MTTPPSPPADHPYAAEIDLERARWLELTALGRELRPAERLEAGYYPEGWSVRDLVGHVGAWLAEGKAQLERIGAGTYDRGEIDIDALNAQFLADLRDQPWDVVWITAQAARSQLLSTWFGLRERTADADWWVAKVGADHYAEHLPRLHVWVTELRRRRLEG